MRIGIKTRPEYQTWAELRDVWVAACSTNVRVDPDLGLQAAADQAAAYREAGADLVIMNLPHRAKPGLLGDLAEALRPLA